MIPHILGEVLPQLGPLLHRHGERPKTDSGAPAPVPGPRRKSPTHRPVLPGGWPRLPDRAITFLINGRHLLMGAALTPHLKHLPKRKPLPALFLMCDESGA